MLNDFWLVISISDVLEIEWLNSYIYTHVSIKWIVYLDTSTVPPDPFTILSYASMAITHSHSFPVAAAAFLIWFMSKLGSVKNSLRILATAIGCKQNNKGIIATKIIRMKQKNLTVNKRTFVDNLIWEMKMHITTTDVQKGMELLSIGTFRISLVYFIGVDLISDFCPVCGVFVSELLLPILVYSSLYMSMLP